MYELFCYIADTVIARLPDLCSQAIFLLVCITGVSPLKLFYVT